jgi:hypothetical protein
MERMLLRPNSSKCEASGKPEAADRNEPCTQIGRVSAAEYFQGHSDKGQLEALFNGNGLSSLSKLGEARRSTSSPRSSIAEDGPIPLPNGGELRTLRGAGNYIAKLQKCEHDSFAWRTLIQALMLVAEHGGDTMLPRIGVMPSCGLCIRSETRPTLRKRFLF